MTRVKAHAAVPDDTHIMNERPLIQTGKEKMISLPDETHYTPHGIVSRTVLRTEHTRSVLFGFSEGQELSEHTSTQHAMIQILSGSCEFTLAGKPQILKSGDLLYMPPSLPHAVKALEQFSMLLTLSKSERPMEKVAPIPPCAAAIEA